MTVAMASDAELDRWSTEKLEEELVSWAGRLAAAEYQWLRLLARFDSQGGWKRWECFSCAHWLNWHCALDLRSAQEKVRVANALAGLPLVSAAFAAGAISYSKVRAITRIAGPSTEQTLLDIAQHSTAAQTERVVAAYRRAERLQLADAQAQILSRSCSWRLEEDGSYVFHVRLPADDGARLANAITSAVDPGATDCTAEQRKADALVAVLVAEPKQPELVVHVDASVLADDDEDGCCHLEHGPAIAAEVARRLGCDATVLTLIEKDGEPLGVGRTIRKPSARLRRLLRARDGDRCQFPGCTHRGWLDAHHLVHWTLGGPTELANLLLLCRRHHRSVHEGGWTIEHHDGRLKFRSPAGWIATAKSFGGPPELAPTETTITPRWYGDPLDLHYTVAVLAQGGLAAGGGGG